VTQWSEQRPSSDPPEPPRLLTNRRAPRRAFLKWAGLAAVGAGATVIGARAVANRLPSQATNAARSRVVLPPPTTATPVPSSLPVNDLTPLITPNEKFFRIDTASLTPQVDIDTWKLRIGGRVANPTEFSFAELLALPQVSLPITLACVSNPVGGDLIGTAVWQGIELKTILEKVEIEPGADQLVATSVDGFTAGFPTAAVFDGRKALLVVGMNGEPLPVANGFPARLVVEGLFGYVSATKWLASLDLRTWDEFNAYWIKLGWSKEGPVLPSARIDVPKVGEKPSSGPLTVAGVAWAPRSGVAAVELQIDEGEWQRCELGPAVTGSTWRQWTFAWNPQPGNYRLRARCVNGDGEVQTGQPTVNPDAGNTGWHTRKITIS